MMPPKNNLEISRLPALRQTTVGGLVAWLASGSIQALRDLIDQFGCTSTRRRRARAVTLMGLSRVSLGVKAPSRRIRLRQRSRCA